ncbi:MAG: FdtA/QdtA family cupin domain-containing protein [Fibrobacter sp.]|nr:FdtA/QdtA family cupin domain-containing protein [Fibrobacter sp.]
MLNFDEKAQIIQLPKFLDERGNLSVLESGMHIPFKIQRCYWIYDVPGGELRGSHAFKRQHEFIVALSGSFDVVVHDGLEEKRYSLSRSYYGLYLPPMHYRTLDNFSTNSLALVLSSTSFEEEDYIRDRDEFLKVAALNVKCPNGVVAQESEPSCVKKSDLICSAKKASVENCSLIMLPRHSERSGCLTSIENSKEIPFDVKRVFYLYDIPGGESRGGHAHKECHQMLVSASGAFDVKVSDGEHEKIFRLDRPYYGLHIPPGVWAEELNFSSGSICLVLTSHEFVEADYWRSYDEYLKFKKA